jgi:hypothetical protein
VAVVRAAGVSPAAGGLSLLRAAETAVATVVGRVREPARIDAHGCTATLVVEQVLVGEARVGEAIRIGWEELSARRPLRFADGEAVLLALDPLPSASLWRQRFAAHPRERVLVVAGGGDAFVRGPDPGTIGTLAAYLALPPPQRERGGGVGALASVVARAVEPVAAAAVDRLAAIADLDRRLTDAARAVLIGTAADTARPRAVRMAVLDLVARRVLRSLRAQLAPLARRGSDVEAAALTAIAVLDGGLPSVEVKALLARRDAAVRAVGARFARGATLQQALPALVRQDPAPGVRAAAAVTLVGHAGPSGLEAAFPALADATPAVRDDVARAIAGLGPPVVPALAAAVRTRPLPEARGIVAALSLIGPAGTRALAEIAATHPSEELRTLARLGLGRAPSEH